MSSPLEKKLSSVGRAEGCAVDAVGRSEGLNVGLGVGSATGLSEGVVVGVEVTGVVDGK